MDFFDILWVPRPSIAVPNLVRIRWNFQGQTAGGMFPDLVFFAPIFWPNYAVLCLTAYISGTKNLRRLKFGPFVVRLEYNTSLLRHRPHRPPCGKGAPSKIGKNRNFRKLSRVWQALGKMFRGFSPRAEICCREGYCLANEENRAGLHSTVSPPNGAERGPVEKFAPPHAQICGLTPNFKILFYGSPGPLQILKISRENVNPFLRKFFFKILAKI